MKGEDNAKLKATLFKHYTKHLDLASFFIFNLTPIVLRSETYCFGSQNNKFWKAKPIVLQTKT